MWSHRRNPRGNCQTCFDTRSSLRNGNGPSFYWLNFRWIQMFRLLHQSSAQNTRLLWDRNHMCFGSEVQDRQDDTYRPIDIPPLTDVFHQRVQCTARKTDMQWGLVGYPEHPWTRPCATTWPWPVHFCSQVASHGQPTSAAAQLSCGFCTDLLSKLRKFGRLFCT